MLGDNLQGHRTRTRHPHRSLLAGKIVDENGSSLTPAHATKGNVRYLYYVSADRSGSSLRIPARQIETAVMDRMTAALADPVAMLVECGIEPSSHDWRTILGAGREQPAVDSATIVDLVREVRVTRSSLEIRCSALCIAKHLGLPELLDDRDIVFSSDVALKRSGQLIKLVRQNGMPLAETPNTSLVRLVLLAHQWWAEVRHDNLSIRELAQRVGVAPA